MSGLQKCVICDGDCALRREDVLKEFPFAPPPFRKAVQVVPAIPRDDGRMRFAMAAIVCLPCIAAVCHAAIDHVFGDTGR